MFKVNNKTPERRQWRCSGVFICNFEHISHTFSAVFISDFEQVNVGGETGCEYAWKIDYKLKNISLETKIYRPDKIHHLKWQNNIRWLSLDLVYISKLSKPHLKLKQFVPSAFIQQFIRDHSFSTWARFSEKLTFLIPWYVHYVGVSGCKKS